MAAIFFSHSSRDDALAREVEAWLRKQGFDDLFVDHGSIRSGDKWTEALRRAGGACRVVLSLVTANWLGSSECFGEFLAGWYAGRRMIALICAPVDALDETQKQRLSRVLLEDQGVDISQAGGPSALDLDAHPEISMPFIEGLRAAGALAKVGLDPSVFPVDEQRDPEGTLLKPPFPGLESFGDTDADAAVFYGRSSEIAQILDELREFRASGDRQAYGQAGRAYVIQGASGSGKSSLLQAGVLPRLRRERGWVALRSFRPGAEPLLAFAEALAKPIGVSGTLLQAPGAIRDQLLSEWRAAKSESLKTHEGPPKNVSTESQAGTPNEIDLKMLRRLRKQLDALITPLKLKLDRPAATALISIDQGEELVRAEGDGADAFSDYLKAALLPAKEGEPAEYAAVLSVRTDSFQELQMSARLVGLGTRPFDLRPLPIYRFAEVIERPAARYGVEIEPQLVEIMMDDAGGMDALPLLAFTLQRLWRQYEVERRIRKVNYESMGRLLGLIEDAAERALRGVDPAAKQGPLSGKVSNSRDSSAQRVFVPGLAQINEGGGTIRRAANLSNFDEEGREILRWFEKWRLVVTSGINVEVAHEALFRAWPRFVHWLEPARARLVALRGLESAAATWNSNERGFDFISHDGRRLRNVQALTKAADFRKYIDNNSIVKDYLRAARVATRGWRIANWYSLISFSFVVAVFTVNLFWAYAVKDYKLLFLVIGTGITLLGFNAAGVLFAYLAAGLRQLVLRSGFQSDVGVLALITVIMLAALWFYFEIVLASQGGFEAAVQNTMRVLDVKDIDVRTYSVVVALGDFSKFLVLPALSWMVLQFAMLVTIPLRFLTRKFSAARLQSASYSVPA
jgi:TIR domain